MNTLVDEHLDNEWFVVRHSGEIPEIALYAARHFLTEAEDGPRMTLTPDQWRVLLEAAGERYREIILRDMEPQNRNTSIYRGLARSIANYQRFECFCRRQGVDARGFGREVAGALLLFLANESVDAAKKGRASCINCTYKELNDFARKIGLVRKSLPPYVRHLCRQE